MLWFGSWRCVTDWSQRLMLFLILSAPACQSLVGPRIQNRERSWCLVAESSGAYPQWSLWSVSLSFGALGYSLTRLPGLSSWQPSSAPLVSRLEEAGWSFETYGFMLLNDQRWPRPAEMSMEERRRYLLSSSALNRGFPCSSLEAALAMVFPRLVLQLSREMPSDTSSWSGLLRPTACWHPMSLRPCSRSGLILRPTSSLFCLSAAGIGSFSAHLSLCSVPAAQASFVASPSTFRLVALV